MTNPIEHLPIKLRAAHLCANLSYAALLGVLTVWALWNPAGFALVLWAIACVPLLILWPGMRKKRYRSYSWLCFVILLYFVKAVEGSLSSVASWIDFTMLVLSVIIFISAMLTSRWLQYTQVQHSQEKQQEDNISKD